MDSLQEIQATLRAALGNPALFSLVNTRLILRTGVDLANVLPVQDADRQLVEKVLSELKAMGYSSASLSVVAHRGKR